MDVKQNGKGNIIKLLEVHLYDTYICACVLNGWCCLAMAGFIGERIVNVGGTECACGGTHVKNTADICGITVTKIKKVVV